MNNPLLPKSNPLYEAARKPKKPTSKTNPLFAPPSPPKLPTAEQPDKPVGAIEAVGNVLDLPGSSVRDVLAGENPFDQWTTPTRSENRTTGKQLLAHHGLTDGSDSWTNAGLGIAAEVLLDPTTYIGVGAFTKGGKALSKAGLLRGTHAADTLTDATRTTVRSVLHSSDDAEAAMRAFKLSGGLDKHLDQPIKRALSFGKLDLAKPLAPAIDKAKELALELPGARSLRAAFSPSVMNTVTKAGQDIAEHRKLALDDALVDIGSRFAEPVRNNNIDGAKSILSDVARHAEESGLEISRFTNHLNAKDVSQALQHSEHLTRASSMAHAAHELLGTAARADGSGVPMADALKRLGIDTEASRRAVTDWADGRPIESLSIDKALLDDAGRLVRPFTDPEAIGAARKAIEGFNRLFKTHVTLPFPQFHARNLAGGQLQNILMGASDIKHLPRDLVNSFKLTRGKTIKGLADDIPEYRQLGVGDEEANKLLRDELFSHNVAGDWQSAIDVSKRKPSATSRMPGTNPLTEAAQHVGVSKQSFNPANVEEFLPTKLGGNVASFVEDLNRITPYINLRRQGYTADEAARTVKQLQVDYSDLTQWEKKWGRNAIPFYSFASRMLPLVTEEIVKHPGGPMAQVIKRTNVDTQEKLGSMHADSAKLFGAALKGDTNDLAKQVGGRLNPLIKLPLEQAAQRDLHTGRPLTSFRPVENLTGWPIGPTAEHVLRSSPAARYLSEAAKLHRRSEKLNSLANVRSGE